MGSVGARGAGGMEKGDVSVGAAAAGGAAAGQGKGERRRVQFVKPAEEA